MILTKMLTMGLSPCRMSFLRAGKFLYSRLTIDTELSPWRVVVSIVSRQAFKQLKVFYSVIKFVSVFVMNDLIFRKTAAYNLGHNVSVLQYPLAIYTNVSVPICSYCSSLVELAQRAARVQSHKLSTALSRACGAVRPFSLARNSFLLKHYAADDAHFGLFHMRVLYTTLT